ncbi:bifunctional phosphoribosylaminoimidazolecarboxamide formyltransferase/IMP cyclohydrolase, partial [bacterium]
MSDRVTVKRALLSVSDKTGLVPFATALAKEFNVELVSTGGTAKALRDAGLTVKDVSELTGFPEMMDGRVKTLHPKVHGGLLAIRDNAAHAASMKEHEIGAIDLVIVNLYPFAATIAKPNCTFEDAIENIDIGGPSMIRSAAKNHHYVTVITDASSYDVVLGELRANAGSTTPATRLALAQKAFAQTGAYDVMIAGYLAQQINAEGQSPVACEANAPLPAALCGTYKLAQTLRYGENPHQPAALYVHTNHPGNEASVARATQHHGKELSYINLLDADAALSVVKEFSSPAACVVKHATPCGVGT